MVKNSRFRFSFLYDTTNFPNSPFFLSTKKKTESNMLSVFPWTEKGIGSFFSVPEAPLFYRSFQFHFRRKLFEELRGKSQIDHANGKPYKAQNHGVFIQIDPDHECEDGSDDGCDEITENVKAFSMSAFDKIRKMSKPFLCPPLTK